MNRSKHIGGSDLQHVLSLPPYGCARQLWYQKREVEPDYTIYRGGVLARGTKLEALVVEEYTERTGRKVRRRSEVRGDAEHEMGQPDRIILNDPRGPGVLECKTANDQVFRKFQREGLPLGYQVQLQWYIGLAGYQWGAFAVLEPSNWRFETFEVEFDEVVFAELREAATLFWARVVNGPAPDPLDASDKRCGRCAWRMSCQGTRLLDAVDADADAEEIPALADLAAEYLELRDVRDEADAAMDAVKAQAQALIGDRAEASTPGYRVQWKPQTSNRVDTNALKLKFPDVYAAVVKPSVSRPFRVLPA